MQKVSKIDLAQWGGLTAGNARDNRVLEEMLQAGAVGLAATLSPVPAPDFPPVSRCPPSLSARLAALLAPVPPALLHTPGARLQ